MTAHGRLFSACAFESFRDERINGMGQAGGEVMLDLKVETAHQPVQ